MEELLTRVGDRVSEKMNLLKWKNNFWEGEIVQYTVQYVSW